MFLHSFLFCEKESKWKVCFYLEHFGKGEKGGHEITSAKHSGSEKVQGDLKKKDLL